MAEIKRLYVEAALHHSQGMQTRAGRLINAHRNTVSRIASGSKRWISTKS
jgi:DNA-binding protein Fis